MTEISPKERVLGHIENVRDWLGRAEDGYKSGATLQGELNLNLAQAELKKAWEESRQLHNSAKVVQIPEVRSEASAIHRKRNRLAVLTQHRAGLAAAVVLLFLSGLTPFIFQGAEGPTGSSGKNPIGVSHIQTGEKRLVMDVRVPGGERLRTAVSGGGVTGSEVESESARVSSPAGSEDPRGKASKAMADASTQIKPPSTATPLIADKASAVHSVALHSAEVQSTSATNTTAQTSVAAPVVKPITVEKATPIQGVVAVRSTQYTVESKPTPGFSDKHDRSVSNSSEEVKVRTEDLRSTAVESRPLLTAREITAASAHSVSQFSVSNRPQEVKPVQTAEVTTISYDVDALVNLAEEVLYTRH